MSSNIGHIVLLGMNHKTAAVELREQLALVCSNQASPLQLFPYLKQVEELFFLSTCNRVEILFTCLCYNEAVQEVKALLRTHLGSPSISAAQLDASFYVHKNEQAVRHLFRVCSSLDSMVVGEPQILGQIKSAYRDAIQYRTVGVILNRLLHKAFSVAKRVRSSTMIGSHAVSISYAAVELARKIFGELSDKRVLVIGAGEMAELAAEHFLAQGVRQMAVANRTMERAVELGRRFRAETVPFNGIMDVLKDVDIVLSSTGSPVPLLKYQDIKSRMRQRRNKPLFFIDIAVPRDIEQKVNEIDNVYLYDIDDLQGVIELNRAERQKEAERAEHIILEETVKFQDWLRTLDVVPTIVALREKAEAIRQNEIRKTFAQLPDLAEKERQAIEILTESILSKLLHDPILFLKKKAGRDSKQLFVDYTQQLFNLSNENTP
ncbi:MAG: glutamyl-tRNA reductase, partial [Desulforhabdus sp.]|nr:glutamyl-tRNA reductase [Desulforhabdus sp.]